MIPALFTLLGHSSLLPEELFSVERDFFFLHPEFHDACGEREGFKQKQFEETYVGKKYPSLELRGEKKISGEERGGLSELGDTRDWRKVPRKEGPGWSMEETSGRLWR